MAVKNLVVLTALPTENEQTGVSPKVATPGTYLSREFGDFNGLARAIFLLDISAMAGTSPTLDVTVQGFDPTSGKWHIVVTFPTQNAVSPPSPIPASSVLHQAASVDFQIYRAQWVVAGAGASFTFSLCAIGISEEPVA